MTIATLMYFCSRVDLEILLVKPRRDIQSKSSRARTGLAGWQESQVPMGFYNTVDKQSWQAPGPPGETRLLCKPVWAVVRGERLQVWRAHMVGSSSPGLSHCSKPSEATQGDQRHRPWHVLG